MPLKEMIMKLFRSKDGQNNISINRPKSQSGPGSCFRRECLECEAFRAMEEKLNESHKQNRLCLDKLLSEIEAKLDKDEPVSDKKAL